MFVTRLLRSRALLSPGLLSSGLLQRSMFSDWITVAAKETVWNMVGKPLPHDEGADRILGSLFIESADKDGLVVCKLPVEHSVKNAYNTMHGGAIAMLVDVVGTMSLLTQDHTKAGVSVDLSVTFCRAAPIGSHVTVEGRVLKYGKRLGFTQVDIYNEDRDLVATGRHTKAM